MLQIETGQDYPAAAAMSIALAVITLAVIGVVARRVRIESVV
jgi:ABC-type spermidine/putrescine transport system permease subunit I